MLGKKRASIVRARYRSFCRPAPRRAFSSGGARILFAPRVARALGSWQPRLRRFLRSDCLMVAEYFARKLNNARLLSFDGKRVTRTDDVHVRHSSLHRIPPHTYC
jgi:hypothetical protein